MWQSQRDLHCGHSDSTVMFELHKHPLSIVQISDNIYSTTLCPGRRFVFTKILHPKEPLRIELQFDINRPICMWA